MTRDTNSLFRRLLRDEKGAVIVLVAAAMVALVGFGALVVDIGYFFYAKSVIQATANAAALAGAQEIGNGGAPLTTATNYSAVAGDKNAVSNLSITMAANYPVLTCASNWATNAGVACSINQTPTCATASAQCLLLTKGATGANLITVSETAKVPTFFGRIFGISSIPITATAMASAEGSALTPYNVAIILDTTASMGDAPSKGAAAIACVNPTTGKTYPSSIECAAGGAQTLLSALWPWPAGATSGTPVDEAALFTFPPVAAAGQATVDIGCTAPQIATSYSGVAGISAASTSTTLNLTSTASVTASISGSVLTVTKVASGVVGVGEAVLATGVAVGASGYVPVGTYVTSLGTGKGGTGTYNLSVSATVASETMTIGVTPWGMQVLSTGSANMSVSTTAKANAFNTGSPWAVVSDAGTPTSVATTTTSKNPNVLTFPSGVITTHVTAGLTMLDRTNPTGIPSGTTVKAIGTTVTGSIANTAGTAAGTVLKVTAVTSGALAVGDIVTGTGITAGTYVISLGTGTGGAGTYNVSISQKVASEAMTIGSASTVTMSSNVAGSGVLAGDLITFGTSIPAGTGNWPWWGTGTTMNSIATGTPGSATLSSGAPVAPYVLQNDTIVAAPLYQIVGFANDFAASDPPTGGTGTLTTSSDIVKATTPGCLGTPGGLGTYYADAISAAQAALAAEQTARGGTLANPSLGGQNVMVLLSDGAASASAGATGQMGPLETAQSTQECEQAILAAQAAAKAGTKVYVIYYDDGSATCNDTTFTKAPGVTAKITSSCTAMQLIANAPAPGTTNGFTNDQPLLFYSIDGTGSPCPSANSYTTVADIFRHIVSTLTNARLVPVNTT